MRSGAPEQCPPLAQADVHDRPRDRHGRRVEKHGQGSGDETANKFSSESGLERADDDAAEAKPNQVRPRPAAVERQKAQHGPDHKRDSFDEDFRHHDHSFVSGRLGGSYASFSSVLRIRYRRPFGETKTVSATTEDGSGRPGRVSLERDAFSPD